MNELPAEILRCQVDSLRDALVKVLDTRKAESLAWLASHNAKESTSDRGAHEEREHLAALDEMLNAEREARLRWQRFCQSQGNRLTRSGMTTPEQQARDMLDRMGFEGSSCSAGDVVELANLIEERDRLRAGIEAALGEIRSVAQAIPQRAFFEVTAIGAYRDAADIIRKHTGFEK